MQLSVFKTIIYLIYKSTLWSIRKLYRIITQTSTVWRYSC